MSRSKWKGYFISSSLLKIKNVSKNLKIWNRDSTISKKFVDKSVFIHNGKVFKKIKITQEKVGFKFGEFSFTRIQQKKKIKISKKNLKKK